ncbi:ABC transporter transmembrane domain-containing protein [Gryllotalpicola protaetiae]|uniref:ABC transporter ATP-binding protein n=1 Tax=Gryllotalpicola protaetiae TaxID=2419771 RepID=A0A387BS53_9MICO|nr:ABC transporter ATP-binding protein [Gryllotalpicola protaetiae]AYG03767.1 ABC transporter ATP-binding protein [Gryllotalpicola protaetiae]
MTTATHGARAHRPALALLRSAVLARRRDLMAACALYCGHQFGEALVPVIVGATVGGAIADGDAVHIAAWLALLAADFVALSLSYRFGARASARAKQFAGHSLRLAVARRALAPAGGADRAPGDLLTRASADADRVGAFAGVIAQTVASAMAVLVAAALLFRIALLLGLAILAGALLLLLAAAMASRRNVPLSHAEQHTAGQAAIAAEDLLRGIRVVKGIGAEDASLARYRALNRAGVEASRRLAQAEASVGGVNALLAGCYFALVAGVGGVVALSGALTIGQLVSALGLCLFVVGPMQAVAGFAPALARARASAERVHEIISAAPAVIEATDATVERRFPAAPTVELVDVELAPGSVASFSFGRGLTGLVCADGAESGRLVELLARLLDPLTGRILVDGADLHSLSLDALRRVLLVGAREQPIFAGTVLENAGLLSAPGGRAVAGALSAAHADELTPDDATTQLGDAGARLSGGQRQRLGLARLLAADAPVLVLENPTSAVDAVTEAIIARRLRELRRERTTLIITTSPALLTACDRVLLLGEMPLSGVHEQLLETEAYRRAVAR